ncbi:MAG TPA: methylenetetrahydrofolate reductase [NAD(P)H] [Polyangiaceae bacterium]|nr:methylenetetrahydrofolate reductase [NAD(P)H] [Polyangiaceae bacterium]
MKISDKLASSARPAFSFEFFPPKDAQGVERLFETAGKLARYSPAFVSVTYGAFGSTRGLTVDLVKRIKRELGLETMAHLTCVGAERHEIAEVLDQLARGEIDNVIALRGDPPQGSTTFTPAANGFSHASELVQFIKSRWSFCVAAACYPEKHPEAASLERDLDWVKHKTELGAELLLTQLFFDPNVYFRFVERARERGVRVPIVPGVMPITNLSQVKRFTAMCGASIPSELLGRLEASGGDTEAVQRIGVEYAVAQCRRLLEGGAPGIHFYTLNRSRATMDVLEQIA